MSALDEKRLHRDMKQYRVPKKVKTPGLPDRVRQLRQSVGWTQKKLAEAIGVTTISVQNWENGRREPSERCLDRIAVVLWKNRNLSWSPEQLKGADLDDTGSAPTFLVKEGGEFRGPLLTEYSIKSYIVEGVGYNSGIEADLFHVNLARIESDDKDRLYSKYKDAGKNFGIFIPFASDTPISDGELLYFGSKLTAEQLSKVKDSKKFARWMSERMDAQLKLLYLNYLRYENTEPDPPEWSIPD